MQSMTSIYVNNASIPISVCAFTCFSIELIFNERYVIPLQISLEALQ